MKSFICLFVFLALTPQAHAANGLVAAAWNQAVSGKKCGDVKAEDIKAAGYLCPAPKLETPAMLQPTANSVLDKLVFEEAAEKQARNDQCVAEALSTIQKNDSKMNSWKGVVVASWLGLKKAQLMRDTCRKLFWNSMDPVEIKRHGLEKAHERRPRLAFAAQPSDKHEGWKSTCLNEDTRAALLSAERLFAYSLPVVSSPEVYQLIEKERNAVVSKATGKPLTDAELLKMNLSDLSQISVKADAGLKKAMDAFLLGHSIQRKKMADGIERTKKKDGNLQDLDSQTRTYLYEEGAVSQVMIDRGLVKLDSSGDVSEISSGAACIMAWNEPTLGGELMELGVTSAIPGGIIYKILGTTAKYAQVSKLNRLKSSMLWGAGAVAVKDMGNQLYRSCYSDIGRASRMTDTKKQDVAVSIESSSLPAEVGYERWNFDFEPAQVPSCSSTTGPNLMLNRAYEANCTRDILLNVLPLTVALPFVMVAE